MSTRLATLSGIVDPLGASTEVHFAWGSTTDYTNNTPTQLVSGTVAGPRTVGTTIGVLPGETYHYRVVAVSSAGVTFGADQTFTTPGGKGAPTPEPVYVADGDTNQVAVFAPGSRGDIAPQRVIAGPLTQLFGPATVAVDPRGDLFVGSPGPARS